MTNTEMKEIEILQKRGAGPARISEIMKLPIGTVKSYVARHQVGEDDVCLCCGKGVEHIAGKRKKVFCSSLCKSKWWNAHPHMMTKQTLNGFTCPVCGREFSDYGRRIYCSVECYAESRRKKNV